MSQKLVALQNRKIAILNRLSEITAQKQILDVLINKLDNSETPVFDLYFEKK
ncbi:MAG: hypothetical protein AABX17_01575 [Nanoarchaeota archaeon]